MQKTVRAFLKQNKDVWEFVLAVLGVVILFQQTDILSRQLGLQEQQQAIVENQNKLGRRNHLTSLRNSIWAIIDHFPGEGNDALVIQPRNSRPEFAAKVRRYLDLEESNPVLQENPQCLARWRNAISLTKLWDNKAIKMPIDAWSDKLFAQNTSKLIKDVMAV